MNSTTLPRRLNLGCGFDKRDGWLNVDNFADCSPDQLLDIEATPWALPSDGFDHVLMKHVLEHVGQDFPTFKRVMQELYRITAPGGFLRSMSRTFGTIHSGRTRLTFAPSRPLPSR